MLGVPGRASRCAGGRSPSSSARAGADRGAARARERAVDEFKAYLGDLIERRGRAPDHEGEILSKLTAGSALGRSTLRRAAERARAAAQLHLHPQRRARDHHQPDRQRRRPPAPQPGRPAGPPGGSRADRDRGGGVPPPRELEPARQSPGRARHRAGRGRHAHRHLRAHRHRGRQPRSGPVPGAGSAGRPPAAQPAPGVRHRHPRLRGHVAAPAWRARWRSAASCTASRRSSGMAPPCAGDVPASAASCATLFGYAREAHDPLPSRAARDGRGGRAHAGAPGRRPVAREAAGSRRCQPAQRDSGRPSLAARAHHRGRLARRAPRGAEDWRPPKAGPSWWARPATRWAGRRSSATAS